MLEKFAHNVLSTKLLIIVLGFRSVRQYALAFPSIIDHLRTSPSHNISADRLNERPAIMAPTHPLARLWKVKSIQQILVNYLAKRDLAAMRLVCHKFAVDFEPFLFADIEIRLR